MAGPFTDTLRDYSLFGLSIRSELALPELVAATAPSADPVVIRCGTVPDRADGQGPFHELWRDGDGAVLKIGDVARFGISEGRRITVDAHPPASDRNVRLYLLGSAMGVLLHQRGLLPLHANAIGIGGRAVAFLGHSGAGKSTLAAAFHDAGHPILSDDVCVVVPGQGGFVVQPGIPRLRLWRDAVERSGRTVEGHERAFDSLDKFTVPTDAATRGEAMRLGAIYLLARADDPAAAMTIRRLAGVEAVRALIENTYRGSFIATVGDVRRHFETCVKLARDVPVFELRRPWDEARIGEAIMRIGAHLAAA